MIPFVIFFSILLLALIELLSRREDLRHLHISFELDSRLVEPGEEICLRYTVRNTSRWPLLYAGLTLRLDPVFLVCEDEEWMRRHATVDFTGTRIDHHFYLLGNRKFSGKLRFSVKRWTSGSSPPRRPVKRRTLKRWAESWAMSRCTALSWTIPALLWAIGSTAAGSP